MENALPPIPAKRYFTIGEVSELCGVKSYVLRYWEQEFSQLRPMKRRGNRRYYQHHEVLLIRRIRELLYDQGFTISGARNRLAELGHKEAAAPSFEPEEELTAMDHATGVAAAALAIDARAVSSAAIAPAAAQQQAMAMQQLREELLSIRQLLAN